MKRDRTCTLSELIELGVEACHVADDGVSWLRHGCLGLRGDSVSGTRTLVMAAAALPVGPWQLTTWGEAELRRSQADQRG